MNRGTFEKVPRTRKNLKKADGVLRRLGFWMKILHFEQAAPSEQRDSSACFASRIKFRRDRGILRIKFLHYRVILSGVNGVNEVEESKGFPLRVVKRTARE